MTGIRCVASAALTAAVLLLGAPAAHAAPDATVGRVAFPTNIDFDPAGGLWVTSGAGGASASDGVWYFPPGGGRRHVIKRLRTALGLAWSGGRLYVSHITSPSNGRVTAFSRFDGRRFTRRRVVVPRLRIGLHTVDSIAAGPDRRLYLGVGSIRDHSGPPGRVLSFRPSGRGLKVEATGLRNPFGLAFIPGTSDLLVTDNQRDDLGPFRPAEELNVLDVTRRAPHFGFPRCPSTCRSPIAKLPAHASSNGIAVSPDWGGEGPTAFIAQFGSSSSRNRTGRDIRKVRLTRRGNGRYATEVSVLDRFDDNPLGAAIGPDGHLYVSLFSSGRVVRYLQPGRTPRQ